MSTVYLLAAFVFGASIGSFLNVVIWRLPQELSLGGRSFCPHCKHQLVWYDLLPLISIIWRKFACGYCHAPISWRYPLIEFITACLFAFAYWFVDPATFYQGFVLLGMWFVLAISIVVFVIDYEHYLILDKIVLPGAVILLLFALGKDLWLSNFQLNLNSAVVSGLAGALLIAGFFYAVWVISKGQWIGFGDVKLGLFMGLALGLTGSVVALFLAFMLGSVVGVGLLVFGNKGMKSQLPFGTFLATGMVVALFLGPEIAEAYLALIGLG